MKVLTVLIVVAALCGCALSPKPVTTPPPRPAPVHRSPWLIADCRDPVDPRDGPATHVQLEDLWGTDTDSLKDCALRHHRFVALVLKRDAALAGAKP